MTRYTALFARIKERYVDSEDLWWMTEEPDVVLGDIIMLYNALIESASELEARK